MRTLLAVHLRTYLHGCVTVSPDRGVWAVPTFVVDTSDRLWLNNGMSTTTTAKTTIRRTAATRIKVGDTISLGTQPVDHFVVEVKRDGDRIEFGLVLDGFDWVYRMTTFVGESVYRVVPAR